MKPTQITWVSALISQYSKADFNAGSTHLLLSVRELFFIFVVFAEVARNFKGIKLLAYAKPFFNLAFQACKDYAVREWIYIFVRMGLH